MSAESAPPPDLLSAGSERGYLRGPGRPGRPSPWWIRLIAFFALALVAVVAGPGLLADHRPDVPPKPQPTPTPKVALAPWLQIAALGSAPLAWAARGNLPPDAPFVVQARARLDQLRPGRNHVLLAHRLPDGSRLVLTADKVPGRSRSLSIESLFGLPGQNANEGRMSVRTTFFDLGEVIAWAGRAGDGDVYAAVLGQPGSLRVALSPQVRFTPDGDAQRRWFPAFSSKGFVVVDLGSEADPGVLVRPEPVYRYPYPFPVTVDEGVPNGGPGPAVGGGYASSYRGPDPDLLIRAVNETMAPIADMRGAELQVVWSGGSWRERRMALVDVIRESGPMYQVLVGQIDDRWFSRGARVVDPDEADRLPWLLGPSSPSDPTMLICPSGPGSLVYRRAGQKSILLPIDETGVVLLVPPGPNPPSPAGARVTVRDPEGLPLISVTLPHIGAQNLPAPA